MSNTCLANLCGLQLIVFGLVMAGGAAATCSVAVDYVPKFVEPAQVGVLETDAQAIDTEFTRWVTALRECKAQSPFPTWSTTDGTICQHGKLAPCKINDVKGWDKNTDANVNEPGRKVNDEEGYDGVCDVTGKVCWAVLNDGHTPALFMAALAEMCKGAPGDVGCPKAPVPAPVVTTTTTAAAATATATTTMQAEAKAGSTALPVTTQNGFSIGQQIIIDQGTTLEETNEIAGFGSIILKNPLKFTHSTGTKIMTTAPAVALPSAPSTNGSPLLPTLSPIDAATPCGAAFDIAANQTEQCVNKAYDATTINTEEKLNMVCTTCRKDFDTTLAAENLAKGCTNASSDITGQTQAMEATLTGVCAAAKSFKYGKKALIGLSIGGSLYCCCLCVCCIGIIMKCAGGRKKRDRSGDDSSEDIE